MRVLLRVLLFLTIVPLLFTGCKCSVDGKGHVVSSVDSSAIENASVVLLVNGSKVDSDTTDQNGFFNL